MSLHVRPLTLKAANELVSTLHRHHRPVTGHRFSIGVYDEKGTPHGAAIVGRPVARAVNQCDVAEVTRLVTDGTPNACSMLYAAAARAASAMGFERIQTYILDSEPGTSLRASGWVFEGHVQGRPWSCTSRPRADAHPTEDKQRWGRVLNPARVAGAA
ncbi:XF1762 family protein [Streptomyces scopuliridis]|uniref:XF1762 family protein n=1 Tax=Streptomyces scopuliridis TaxID=452529 RepID=UPI00398D0D50